MTAENSVVKQLRKAHADEVKQKKRLNKRLLEFEAREALDQKSRIAYQMARQARFPDAGVKLFLDYLRLHPEANIRVIFAELDEAYESAQTKKPKENE